MSDKSAAERQRRYRERRREGTDVVRSFLDGVINDAKRAIANGDVKPYQLAKAEGAIDVLTKMARPGAERRGYLPGLVLLSGEEVDERFTAYLRDFPIATRAQRTVTATSEQALQNLKWADDERLAGRGSTTVLATGIRAARRLVADAHRPEVEAAYGQCFGWETFYVGMQQREDASDT